MGGYTLREGGGRSERDEPSHLVFLAGQFIRVARSMHASESRRLVLRAFGSGPSRCCCCPWGMTQMGGGWLAC